MKHITTYMLITLFFASNIVISMDIIQTTKDTSHATKLALEAIEKDSVIFLKAALAMGADIKHISEYECNFLLSAVKRKRKETALYLSTHEYFQDSSIINKQSALGHTVLMCASYNGYKQLVENVLKIKNINLDLQDNTSWSALHYACYANHSDIITLLLEHGANPMLQDSHGTTAACYKSIIDNPKLDQSMVKKIMDIRDTCGNNQLHLLTTADIGEMAKSINKTIDVLFANIIEPFIKLGINIWHMNNYHMLAVETAYTKYKQLHQQYLTTRRAWAQDLLNAQEKMLHLLLLYYIKESSGKPIAIASSCPQQLNVETAIAEKYKNNEVYYTNYSIEYKDKIKQQLHNLPTLTRVWVSIVPVNSYIPPQLVD